MALPAKLTGLNLKIVLATSVLFFAAYISLIITNYYQAKNQYIQTTIDTFLPVKVDNIYKAISYKLNSGIAVATTMAQSEVLIEWLSSNEENPEKIANYLKRLQTELNLNFDDLRIDLLGFISNQTGNIYNHRGVFAHLDSTYKWYYEMSDAEKTLGLGINPGRPGGSYYLWINKKIFDHQGNLLGINWCAYRIDQLASLVQNTSNRW